MHRQALKTFSTWVPGLVKMDSASVSLPSTSMEKPVQPNQHSLLTSMEVRMYARLCRYECMHVYGGTNVCTSTEVRMYARLWRYECMHVYGGTNVCTSMEVRMYARLRRYECMHVYGGTNVCTSTEV